MSRQPVQFLVDFRPHVVSIFEVPMLFPVSMDTYGYHLCLFRVLCFICDASCFLSTALLGRVMLWTLSVATTGNLTQGFGNGDSLLPLAADVQQPAAPTYKALDARTTNRACSLHSPHNSSQKWAYHQPGIFYLPCSTYPSEALYKFVMLVANFTSCSPRSES